MNSLEILMLYRKRLFSGALRERLVNEGLNKVFL